MAKSSDAMRVGIVMDVSWGRDMVLLVELIDGAIMIPVYGDTTGEQSQLSMNDVAVAVDNGFDERYPAVIIPFVKYVPCKVRDENWKVENIACPVSVSKDYDHGEHFVGHLVIPTMINMREGTDRGTNGVRICCVNRINVIGGADINRSENMEARSELNARSMLDKNTIRNVERAIKRRFLSLKNDIRDRVDSLIVNPLPGNDDIVVSWIKGIGHNDYGVMYTGFDERALELMFKRSSSTFDLTIESRNRRIQFLAPELISSVYLDDSEAEIMFSLFSVLGCGILVKNVFRDQDPRVGVTGMEPSDTDTLTYRNIRSRICVNTDLVNFCDMVAFSNRKHLKRLYREEEGKKYKVPYRGLVTLQKMFAGLYLDGPVNRDPSLNESAYAYILGRGHVRMVSRICGSTIVASFDLVRFFESIKWELVWDRLQGILPQKPTIEAKRFMKNLIMNPSGPGIVIGAATSPAVSNLVAAKWIDEPVQAVIRDRRSVFENRGFQVKFARYADDCFLYVKPRDRDLIVLSSDDPIIGSTESLLNDILSVIEDSGFRVHREGRKAPRIWVRGSGNPLWIMGIRANGRRPGMSKKRYRDLRVIVHNISEARTLTEVIENLDRYTKAFNVCPEHTIINIRVRAMFDHLMGMISYLMFVEKGTNRGEKYRELLVKAQDSRKRFSRLADQ